MTRTIYMIFGLVIYAIFFATFLYLIAFVGNVPFVPRTVDIGPPAPLGVALIIDIAMIALFGVQHSVMARRSFKVRWTRIVPPPIERSVYVLVTSVVLILLFAFWRPIGGHAWNIANPIGATLLWGLFGLGWLIVLLSTFLINHFELFGLEQVWLNLRSRAAAAPVFRTPFFYKFVRHPLYSGFFLALWATPAMSWGHLLLALGLSAYMLIAIPYEERDLTATFGGDYARYRGTVGKLFPRLRR